jgi:uncharacterized protein YndB with AHSA1/START domain
MTESETRTLVIERELPHPPEKVWRALTQGQLIKQWLMDNDFEPMVGHQFNFRATPVPPQWDGVIHSEVLAVEPNKKVAYRWNTMGVDTVVSWTLAATENGTLLRLEQSGFGPAQRANYNGAKHGWTNFIGRMERVVGELQ